MSTKAENIRLGIFFIVPLLALGALAICMSARQAESHQHVQEEIALHAQMETALQAQKEIALQTQKKVALAEMKNWSSIEVGSKPAQVTPTGTAAVGVYFLCKDLQKPLTNIEVIRVEKGENGWRDMGSDHRIKSEFGQNFVFVPTDWTFRLVVGVDPIPKILFFAPNADLDAIILSCGADTVAAFWRPKRGPR